jgi:TPR repeat protein
MGVWTALFLSMRFTGFVEAPHPGASIAFWEKAAEENRPHAVENLRVLLAEFANRDVDDAAQPVLALGTDGPLNREQGLGILCNQVGNIYAAGKYVPADPARAAYYYEKACEQGNPDGCANLVIAAFRNHQTNTPDLDRALSTLEQSAAGTNNGRICYLLGYAWDSGHGRPVDKARARQFYAQGAVLGDVAAWKTLARMLLAGEGGPADHAAAAGWLQKAADAQDGPSCLNLARLYHTGDGVPPDEKQAQALLEKACELGEQPACLLLQQSRQ